MTEVTQIWVLLTGALSLWIFTNPDTRHHRAGCWVGLAGQPAWFFTTYQNFQWGMFLLSLWVTANYVRGILRHRVKSPMKVEVE